MDRVPGRAIEEGRTKGKILPLLSWVCVVESLDKHVCDWKVAGLNPQTVCGQC